VKAGSRSKADCGRLTAFWVFLLSDIVNFFGDLLPLTGGAHARGPQVALVGVRLFNQGQCLPIETRLPFSLRATPAELMFPGDWVRGAMPSTYLAALITFRGWEPRSWCWRCGSSPGMIAIGAGPQA